MPHTQRSQIQPITFRCRFEMTAADAPFGHEFCEFEFPGCQACSKALHSVRTASGAEDPMKSEVWHAWIARVTRPKLFAPIKEVS
jgi:hypothetical protein